jgi:hypothetical protein
LSETIWKPVLEADLQRTCMNPLLNAHRTAALATAQADPLIGAIEDAVAEVRAAVETCARNLASVDTTTVPPGLRSAACWIALSYLATRVTVIKLTADQNDEIGNARKKVEMVAKCELAVAKPSEPLSPGDVQRAGGASVVAADPTVRTTTREQMSGL